MNIVTLTRAHMLHLAKTAKSSNRIMMGNILDALPVYTMPGRGHAIMDNGEIYAAWGLAPVWDGVAEGWMVPSKLIDSRKISVARAIRRQLERDIVRLKLRRVQAAVRKDFNEAHQFIKFLGFESEGIMHRFGPDGADYERYARWQIR